MATITPIDNTAFATAGERRFYAFLRDAVKPDAHCLAWYSPSIDGLEPDFVLYTPEEGLLVFEVKDWLLSQIRGVDPRSVTLALPGGHEEARSNPLQQGRGYVFTILNRIKASCRQLLSTEPRYFGKPRVPVQCGLVFTNITRDEFLATDLPRVFPIEKILFSDDLDSAAAQQGARSDSLLRKRLTEMFPPPFPVRLAAEDIAALRELLWPQVRIMLPERAGKPQRHEGEVASLPLLDAQQESLARRLDARLAVVQGPAGTGKSLVLAAKAVQAHARLRQRNSDLPVLIVCFNLTLVHYLKRLLAGHGARMGRKDIHVTHFYEFCRSLLREPLAYDRENSDYYALVTQMALEAAADAPRYGAIFVDEGQDFSDAMLDVPRACLAPEGMFWVALDTAQDIYDIPRTWLENRELRHFFLRRPYRATEALTAFCETFTEHPGLEIREEEIPAQEFATKNMAGEPPRLHKIAGASEGAACIIKRIRHLHDQGVPYSEMMILYTSRHYGGLDGDLPLFLRDALEESGILASWPARDAQSKAGWDITTDSVSISTIHSMKGMDAEAVFVLGLDSLASDKPRNTATLAYVACTRARRFLDILYVKETPLIAAIRNATK